MHPSQAVSRQQIQMFDALSGIKEGLTYRLNYYDDEQMRHINSCNFYLNRVGAQLQILCYINNRFSHISDASYIHNDVMETWQAIKASAAQINKYMLT